MKEYKKYKKEIGKHPSFTCPSIDSVIESMEQIRDENDDLRTHMTMWMDACKELSTRIDMTKRYVRSCKLPKDVKDDFLHYLNG